MKATLIAHAILLCAAMPAFAQAPPADTGSPSFDLSEVVISTNKFAERKKHVAQQVLVLTAPAMQRLQAANSADLLQLTGQVFVQKSQQGGGSPVLRGFEASRILLVVDGVRMNNAMYRAGHLQNIITIDNNLLERTEVLYGPSSTVYGSDALGGVIHFYTRNPELSGQAPSAFSGRAMLRYASANNGVTAHASLNAGFKKWASLTAITASRFGHLRQGDRRSSRYPDFGKLLLYPVRRNGADTFLHNNRPNLQRGSAYDQLDVLQKILFHPNDRISHLLNLQLSTSGNIPRYDRLSRIRGNAPEFAAWHYGPQKRNLAAYTLNARLPGRFFSQLRAGAHYQYIRESRHERRFRRPVQENRTERLHVYGLNLDMRHAGPRHELNIGLDGQFNDLRSAAFGNNVDNGEITEITTRYPNGRNHMTYAAAYASHIWKIVPGKLVLNDGLRLNYVSLRSTIRDNSKTEFPFTSARNSYAAFSGNLGLIYMPAAAWRFSLLGATGFRAPNVDDLGKIFDSQPGAVIVPNPGLRPEYTYNIDLTIQHTIAGKVRLELTGFYTWFRNAVVTDRFAFNGQDSILYGGVLSQVLANQNKARAFLYGGYAGVAADITPRLLLNSALTYTYGRFKEAGAERPLDHIPPVYGRTGLQYHAPRFYAGGYALYNGWKRAKDYNLEGEDNFASATADGMPAWYTLNIQGGLHLLERWQLEASLENLLDRNYRVFASGISAPGRNLIVTVRGRF